MVPGPPFVFGALLVMCALLVAEFIPSSDSATGLKATSRRQSGNFIKIIYQFEQVQNLSFTENFSSGSELQNFAFLLKKKMFIFILGSSVEVHYEIERLKKHDGGVGPLSPLVDHNSAVL